jgi:hypothetical protein
MPKPRNSQAVHDSIIHDGNANGQLGWILVRNLGQKQLQAGNVDRDTDVG